MSLDQIEVSGDFPLGEVQEKTKTFEFCLERIDRYFGKDSGLSCTVGTFPKRTHSITAGAGAPGPSRKQCTYSEALTRMWNRR